MCEYSYQRSHGHIFPVSSNWNFFRSFQNMSPQKNIWAKFQKRQFWWVNEINIAMNCNSWSLDSGIIYLFPFLTLPLSYVPPYLLYTFDFEISLPQDLISRRNNWQFIQLLQPELHLDLILQLLSQIIKDIGNYVIYWCKFHVKQ